MDLCLPENWEARCGGMFRDDLGAGATPCANTSHASDCGLRDWRTPAATRTIPARGSKTSRRAPMLVPYRAPGWLRELHPASTSDRYNARLSP